MVSGSLAASLLVSAVQADPSLDLPDPVAPEESLAQVAPLKSEELVPEPAPEVPVGEFEVPVKEAVPDEDRTPKDLLGALESDDRSQDWAEDLADAKVLERDELSTTYDVGNGQRATELSSAPVNVQSSSGKWAPALPFVTSAENGDLEVPAHPLKPKFSASSGGDATLIVQRDGYEVTVALAGASSRTVVDGIPSYYVVLGATAILVHNGCGPPRAANYSGSSWGARSKAAAIAKAKQVASRTRGEYRGPCKAGNHCHVDFFNGRGELKHTIHIRWKK